MPNLETWRRITRIMLLDLTRELGDAAMATLPQWPSTGEGRQLKQACEYANRALFLTNTLRLKAGMAAIEVVVDELQKATETTYFAKHIANRRIKSGRWKGEQIGQVVEAALPPTATFIREHASEVRRLTENAEAAITRDDLLATTVPEQQIGPLQFIVRDGVLRLARQEDLVGDRNPVGAEEARVQLASDAAWLVENLSQANVDRRVVEIMQDMATNLSVSSNVVRVGIINVACENLVGLVVDELPSPVAAKWTSFSFGVSLYVSQFSEWHTFVENAAAVEVSATDAKRAVAVGQKLVTSLQDADGLVEPEVPGSLKLLLEAMTAPGRSSKRLLYAVVRTIENLIAAVFREAKLTVAAGLDGARAGVKKGAGVATLAVIAAAAATQIAPSAKHVLKTDWMKHAAEVVLKNTQGGL